MWASEIGLATHKANVPFKKYSHAASVRARRPSSIGAPSSPKLSCKRQMDRLSAASAVANLSVNCAFRMASMSSAAPAAMAWRARSIHTSCDGRKYRPGVEPGADISPNTKEHTLPASLTTYDGAGNLIALQLFC